MKDVHQFILTVMTIHGNVKKMDVGVLMMTDMNTTISGVILGILNIKIIKDREIYLFLCKVIRGVVDKVGVIHI
jgi:hypothetical protein